jgi:predicted peptidase
MKAQIGLEYMVVVALVITILVPLFYYANEQFELSRTKGEANIAMNTIITSVNTVYAQSPGSKLTANVYIPKGYHPESSRLVNKTIMMNYTAIGGGAYPIMGVAKCNVSGRLPPYWGYHVMTFTLTPYGNVSINASAP